MNEKTRALLRVSRILTIVFSVCTVLGVISIAAADIYMPRNEGGLLGRLAIYRYQGAATFCWGLIAMGAWYQSCRIVLQNKLHSEKSPEQLAS